MQSTNEAQRNLFNFNYSVLALRLLTCLWLYWQGQQFVLLLQRPPVLFGHSHPVLEALMPALPTVWLYFGMLGLAAALTLYQLLKNRTYTWLQGLLVLLLLWLNLPQWGYGYLSHVNHLFLLAHLFLVFIPAGRAATDVYLHKSIHLFYAGLLVTYTLASFWKMLSLLYKLLTNTTDVHWLHPDATLYNAIVSHRSLDLPFKQAAFYTDHTFFWQVSFLVVVYFQGISFFAAFRQSLRPWVGLFLVLFHLVNIMAFHIHFVVAILTLICLFFPYDLLFPGKARELAVEAEAPLITPAATAFEWYRARLQEKNFYGAGLLYLPGLATISRVLERLQK